jgi:hypothetical protein
MTKGNVKPVYLCGECPSITVPFSEETFNQHIKESHPELFLSTWWAQNIVWTMEADKEDK